MASSVSCLLQEVSRSVTSSRDRNAKDLSSLLANPHLNALASVYDHVICGSNSALMTKSSTSLINPPRPGNTTGNNTTRSNYSSRQSFEMDMINSNSRNTSTKNLISSSSGSANQLQPFRGGSQATFATTIDYDDYNDQVPSNALRVISMRKKDDEPLGMTFKVERGQLVIARILADGLAHKQGLLHVGDTIMAVNNRDISTPEELMDEVRRSKGSVNFKVIPSFSQPAPQQSCYMRALYTYDPSLDTLIPCKELGLSFVTGEVLEVLNQEDPNWWQARKLTELNLPTGLIPSQELEERRRAFVLPEFDYATKTSICGTKVTKQKKKEMYQLQHYNEFEKADLLLYEEVCRMPPFERRTLVLIGAQGVGRRTLKNRLTSYDPERFDSPLPHTSRPIREMEVDGKQYHFVKREIMEADINDNKYLEAGEFQGHLYGTKLDSIRSIIRSGKMAVIDCNPQCLKLLKTKEFMPFVVFIAAPSIDQLRYMHEWGKQLGFGSSARDSSRTYTFDRAVGRNSRRGRTLQSLASFYEDEDLQATIEESARLYRTHETQFDLVLVNNNFEKTFEQLRESLDALSTEPQWVPMHWVYDE